MKTIKARYSRGVIKPLEKLPVPEGMELTVVILNPLEESCNDLFLKAAGGWKGKINADKLIKDIYADRLAANREFPKLS